MSKRTVILIGVICVALAGQTAHALTSVAPSYALRAMSGIWLGQVPGCTCVLDQDGSGELIQIQDILTVIDCAEGNSPTSCEFADLNCDGVIDFCDASRVWCAFVGGTNCCELDMACGACCHSSNFGNPCLVMSEQFCNSALFDSGIFHGAGTVCDPFPCEGPPPSECSTDADCDDQNFCTDDVCTSGTCVHENQPNGTACPDDLFCNGDETCQFGDCQFGPIRTCDDGLSCTLDTCNEDQKVCINTPDGCNNDGVCDSPCESVNNCPGDCSVCNCVVDQDGSGGLIQIQDILIVIECAEGITPTAPVTCENADLNCDGMIDFCDASRVWCAFVGGTNCCELDMACGACCHSSNFGNPCLVMSEQFCNSAIFDSGIFHGAGTTCDPNPCDTPPQPECTSDADCVGDGNVCTSTTCNVNGICETSPEPWGTSCDDGILCNGHENCQNGVCQTFSPPSCSDALDCTTDTCNVALDKCEHEINECNNDGVCNSPCETIDNCPGDCSGCNCVVDQNNDFIVSLQDILTVVDCAEGRTPSPPFTCDKADLDCNGVINYCDASRVFCSWIGFANCCEMDLPCGACCNSGANFNRSCLVVSEFWCTSGVIIEEGVYQGDGTVCTPDPCNGTPECTADIDCDDGNVCNTNICNANGFCETTDKPNGTNCPDGVFCNGDELCQMGFCQAARSQTCDDLNPCTLDTCDVALDVCVNTHIECNNDGVCDAPCENIDNCVNDCSTATCTATRDLSDGSMAYCPETIKTVRIILNIPVGAVSGAVEDSPPTGWIQISNISDGGAYDATNHKVKWGPFFAPFPAELTYDIVPPVDAVGMMCFSGTTAFDGGSGEPICGDECFEDSCCPDSPADEPQSTCTGCSDNCSATAGDGRVELCEVIRYACAWKRGCNDDLTGVSGGAFIWMTSECYCWDATGTSWVPQTCGQSTSACCAAAGQGQGTIAANFTGTATVTMDSIRLEGTRRRESPKARGFEISVSIDPPVGTSAVALDLEIPKGMVVNAVSDGGAWDRLHRKVKWGPYFSDEPLTVTVTVKGSLRRTRDRGFTGTVSYDGKNYPIAME